MKRLIIAPHVDDDVLGCGGILDETCVVFYCGVDEHHRVSANVRFEEAQAVAERVDSVFWWPRRGEPSLTGELVNGGGTWEERGAYVTYSTQRDVNRYTLPSLIADFEKVLTIENPDEVYIPEPSSYNQDHRAAYEAAMVALRPHDELLFVPHVFAYEQPHVMMWPIGEHREPNYFRAIDVEEKVQRYELMMSQVRDFRSPVTIRSLAQLRGAQARVPAAEAFRILRWVD